MKNKYEQEAKDKYGEEVIQASINKLKGVREQQITNLTNQLNEKLFEAFQTQNPTSLQAQQACELHKQWICLFWPDGMYSKEAHLKLVMSYLEDERFVAYYDQIAKGCCAFFVEAMKEYLK